MNSYKVNWVIDIEAASPRDAAEQALAIQRRPDSIATVFSVSNGTSGFSFVVDLTDGTLEPQSIPNDKLAAAAPALLSALRGVVRCLETRQSGLLKNRIEAEYHEAARDAIKAATT
jgi:hypothetical protein